MDTFTAKERKSHARQLRKKLPHFIESYRSRYLTHDYTDEEHELAFAEYQALIWSGTKPEDMAPPISESFLGLLHHTEKEFDSQGGESLYKDLLLVKLLKYLEPDACPLVFWLIPSESWWTVEWLLDEWSE